MKENEYKEILIIIGIFLIVESFFFFNFQEVYWDEAVYVGMGKFIYSFGKVGLYEPARPLVLPVLLGFFWKINVNLLLGRLLIIIFSLGLILLTYLISFKIFNKKIAIFSSLFLAFSSTFFLFSQKMLTGIPSTFFTLLGFYLLIKKYYRLSGLIFGIAFMSRFFQIFTIISVFLFLILLVIRKKVSLKHFLKLLLFFLIPITPYLILNSFLFKNPLYPFLLQSYMTKYTGWLFHKPFYFYFINLIRENILIPFSIIGMILILKQKKFNKWLILITFLFGFIAFDLTPHKEMRLLIPILPFLYILTSCGLFYFVDLFKKNKKLILSLFLIIWFVQTLSQLKYYSYKDNLDPFYNYMSNTEINSGLWISNPAFIIYSNEKAEELIYYPLYNSEKIKKLQTKIEKAKHVLLNTCDVLPCPPNDKTCNQEHDNFLNILNKNLNIVFYQKYGECEYYIFKS
jgi:4-amino-4-deoxy-L-arabinose transferase-like glycosyltransferase